MDNLNSPEQSDLSWLIWSTFLNQAPFTAQTQAPEAAYFFALIEASLQGDSCIEISPEQIETLGQLVISAEQAKSSSCPLCPRRAGVGIIPILEPRATSS